ncbi:inorganic phosphate transporter [Halorussus marinus]|uniref:inorganic phosphate transporter n=1 Tax=Halorussus marinus TaxID=2505976 RepID=UPI00106EA7E0|nr:inorganic phosphate transporter [Halorussus marinus]
MAVSTIFVVGVIAAVFVGVNVGGSSTGVAFGPATGSGVLSMRRASGLMAVFVVLGGFTIGTNVVDTLGTDFVPAQYFTLGASIGILLFIGLGILLGNVLKVSTSTSQTAVAAVVGMGAALGVLDWRTVGVVGMWWLLSTILAFWLCAFVGRYFYDAVVDALDLESGDSGRLAEFAVIAIGCYMAFSAGASNVANAVAPLVGSGELGMTTGVAIGGVAIGVGAFALGPRTMETVGEDITDLSLEASLIAELIAASILTGLSWAGIPASLAVVLTACVIGLGWGRASRRVPIHAMVDPDGPTDEARSTWAADQLDLFDPATTKRIVTTWIATPTAAGLIAFVTFELAEQFRLLS